FENQNRMQQELLDNLNQKRGNGIDTLIPSQPKENISQDGDCLDGVVMDRTLAKDLLKNFPIVPDSHYIRREKWITKICDKLKEIGMNGGQVLIYGSPGIGKTVAVAQAVERSVIELGHFQSYKAYWLDIGKINEDQLAEKLKSLYQILSGSKVFSNELPSILDNINRLFEEDTKVGNNLFVFDNIWHPSYYDYFKFAKKSIATSREITPNNKLQPSIEISEGFTDIEVREVFKKYENIENAKICKEEAWINDIIKASGGLPLAIGLIGGLGLRTNEQWKNALNSIRDAKCPVEIPNYEHNLWGTMELSIKNLGEHEQKFRQLGAFKYPKVSIDSITSLWQCEKEAGQSILREFHSKSLLKSLDYDR
ncbi:Apoptotic protease-activating factor 1, partial [Trichoplax sp. H2]